MGQNDIKPLDKRLIQRNINDGRLTAEEFEKHIKSLPDEADNAEWVALDQDETQVGDSLSDSDLPDDQPVEGNPDSTF